MVFVHCTSPQCIHFYQSMKFQVDSLYSLKIMAPTIFGWMDRQTKRKVTLVYPPNLSLVGVYLTDIPSDINKKR